MIIPDWIGRSLSDRYEILELLGQGEVSAVYRARDLQEERDVVVKIFHPQVLGVTDFSQRFEDMATAVLPLQHPNIIATFAFNRDGDNFYIISDYVPGENLETCLKQYRKDGKQLPLSRAIDIAAEAADGLEYAHAQGTLHRDVRPGSIVISTQGTPLMTDFGISRILGVTQPTGSSTPPSTAYYLSPEQIKGERVNGRADVYALAAVLYEMLSGRPPYAADSAMKVLMQHLTEEIPNVQALRPDVPDALAQAVTTGLAKTPGERYASAAEFAAALRAIELPPEPTPVPPVLPEEPQPEPEEPPQKAAAPAEAPPATGVSLDAKAHATNGAPAPLAEPADGGDRLHVLLIGTAVVIVLALLAFILWNAFL